MGVVRTLSPPDNIDLLNFLPFWLMAIRLAINERSFSTRVASQDEAIFINDNDTYKTHLADNSDKLAQLLLGVVARVVRKVLH